MERIELSIDVFDRENQRARVRSDLPVYKLIASIQDRFKLEPGNYVLVLKSNERALEANYTLEQQAIRAKEQLVLKRQRRANIPNGTTALPRTPPVFVQEVETSRIFTIEWQPALIGRPSQDDELNGSADPANAITPDMLAVDLGAMNGASTVSRRQANLWENDDHYTLESLKAANPAYVNGIIVKVGRRQLLKHGDKITVGSITLVFNQYNQVTQFNQPETD